MFSDLPIWIFIAIALVLTHITIVSVTIYLHRHQAHRALRLHPVVSHFFRFWLWLTTGIVTREWVAIHRKHHARVEAEEDPHSPVQYGIKKVLFEGAELYRAEARNSTTLQQYSHGTPDDWLERNLYSRYSYMGIVLMFVINVTLLGPIGITIWAVQMAWIPFFAAGIINGVGHWWGYRNFEPADASTNILPVGVLIGGEELHNNHHAFASSARFSSKWYELDIGWAYICLLQAFGLARVMKVAPQPKKDFDNDHIDPETLKAVISNRLHVMSDYASDVIRRVYREEKARADAAGRKLLRRSKRLLVRHQRLLDDQSMQRLETLLAENQTLKIVYEFNQRLQAIWQEKTASQESLIQALQDWCHHAEQTGIQALEDFSRTIRAYRLQPA
ncbi:MAG: transposase [Gammaproteobacteria bacterium]